MDKDIYLAIADLLRRRDNQRQYANHHDNLAEKATAQAEHHREEIRVIQRKLYELGYTGQ